MNKYNLSDFDYQLPQELIALNPMLNRDKSKLLVVDQDKLHDLIFEDITKFIAPNDLIVFNDSKVIKARIFGSKITGGKIELLFERLIDTENFIAHVKSNKTISKGLIINLPNDCQVMVMKNLGGVFQLKILTPVDFLDYLEQYGKIPLPPYINRMAVATDSERYQTVYAKHFGSVAAPTAGLHFTPELINKIKQNGTNVAHITLHVGSGTFKPVNVEEISTHKMHSEVYTIDQTVLDAIHATQKNRGRVIAVGTTSLRTLESFAANNYTLGSHETDIFITPGFKFQLVDRLITNFHLPKSTLLMLVAAFVGLDTIKQVYQHAIMHKYRFFSYGDAMLLNFRK